MCAEDITEDVMLLTVARAPSLTDFAEVVAADATSLAEAAMFITKVTISAFTGAASLADTGILFPAGSPGVVTIGVAPLAVATTITVEVQCLVNAEEVTVGVTDLPMLGWRSRPTRLGLSQ